MIIYLNEQKHEVEDGASLAFFVEKLGLKPQGIAIAINEEVVPKSRWDTTILSDKLELLLIHAVSGG